MHYRWLVNNMKKRRTILLIGLGALLFSCSPECEIKECENVKPEIEFKNVETDFVPYKEVTSEDGKSYIADSKNNPQLVLSTLLRTDLALNADFFKSSELKDYFEIAKLTGFNTIDLIVTWREIEPKKNDYQFENIKNYIDFANEFGLKINFIWYGSIVDGESHGANIPKYILNDEKTYPHLVDLFDGGVFGRYSIYDWSNPKLIEREQKALYAMCNFIGEYLSESQIKDTVMMIQLGQGVDRFYRWRIAQYTVPGKDAALMNQEEAETITNNYLNEMGKAVKYSSYKAITRSEFCEQSGVINYVRNAKNNEFVDIVCPTYLHDVAAMRNGIKSFVDEFEGMPVLNVENWANDINHKATLANIALGASGYTCYQLSAPLYYPELPNGALYERYNPNGNTLEEKFVEKKDRVINTSSIVNALNNVSYVATTTKRSNFAAYGFDNRISDDSTSQKVYLNGGILTEYNKAKSGMGFAIYSSNYIYAYSNVDASMTFTNCTLITASSGKMDQSGEWDAESSIILDNNTTLNLEKGKTYRIRVGSVEKLPDSKKLSEDGYYSTYDSIRSA